MWITPVFSGILSNFGCTKSLFILESVKKLEKLFIAPKARQILHETAHRALARCECAQHMGFLMKYFHQESVSKENEGHAVCLEFFVILDTMRDNPSIFPGK